MQISSEKIGSPKFKSGDIVVALSERSVVRTAQYVDKDTIFIYDKDMKDVCKHLPKEIGLLLPIPAIDMAKRQFHPRVFNVIVMGALIEATKIITLASAKKALEEKLAYKFVQNPQLRELNFRALEKGVSLVKETLSKV